MAWAKAAVRSRTFSKETNMLIVEELGIERKKKDRMKHCIIAREEETQNICVLTLPCL